MVIGSQERIIYHQDIQQSGANYRMQIEPLKTIS